MCVCLFPCQLHILKIDVIAPSNWHNVVCSSTWEGGVLFVVVVVAVLGKWDAWGTIAYYTKDYYIILEKKLSS